MDTAACSPADFLHVHYPTCSRPTGCHLNFLPERFLVMVWCDPWQVVSPLLRCRMNCGVRPGWLLKVYDIKIQFVNRGRNKLTVASSSRNTPEKILWEFLRSERSSEIFLKEYGSTSVLPTNNRESKEVCSSEHPDKDNNEQIVNKEKNLAYRNCHWSKNWINRRYRQSVKEVSWLTLY